MKIHTKAVHAGDRKKGPAQTPVTTPIFTASSYFCDRMEELDRIFAREEAGYCYSRYDNPTNAALEELVTALEGGAGALACASGMGAIQIALLAALTDRRKSIVAADALYGAQTARAVENRKLHVDIMPGQFTVPGMLDAIENHFRQREGAAR